MNISETILSQLPKMKTSAELLEELMILPEYDEAIRWKDQADRLLGLQDIYRIKIFPLYQLDKAFLYKHFCKTNAGI